VHSDITAEHPRRMDNTATWFFRTLHPSCTNMKMDSKNPPKHRNTLTSYSLPLLQRNKTRIIKMKDKVGPPHNIKVHGGKRGIAPFILNLDSRRRWVADFTYRPLYPWGKNSTTAWTRGWVGPKAGLEDLGGKKTLAAVGIWTADLLVTPTTLSRLPWTVRRKEFGRKRTCAQFKVPLCVPYPNLVAPKYQHNCLRASPLHQTIRCASVKILEVRTARKCRAGTRN
jgi:hypothetical protein